jgi:hypothetical protein
MVIQRAPEQGWQSDLWLQALRKEPSVYCQLRTAKLADVCVYGPHAPQHRVESPAAGTRASISVFVSAQIFCGDRLSLSLLAAGLWGLAFLSAVV